MRNRPKTYRPFRAFEPAFLSLVVLCAACGAEEAPDGPSNGSVSGEPTDVSEPSGAPLSRDPSSGDPPDGPLGTDAVLDARLREWSERRIVVDYTLHNLGDAELVVLDASDGPLQIERLDDGRVRLFRGKQDTAETDFAAPPTIEGRTLVPGASVVGSGSRTLPFALDYAFDRTIDLGTDTVEFCVGHGPASELLSTRGDDGSYPLNDDLALQRFACTTLERASAPTDGGASPLGDDEWERTLERVLETVGGEAHRVALEAVLALRLPRNASDVVDGVEVIGTPVSITLADGTPAARTRASCAGGGGFALVSTSEESAPVSIEASGCVLGARRISGRAVRTGWHRPGFLGKMTIVLEELTVREGARRLRVSAARYDIDENHPTRVSTWSGTTYRREDGGEVRTVRDLALEDAGISGAEFDRSLSASFTVTASWTDARGLAITTPRPFTDAVPSATGDFTRGTLVVETADGDRMTLDADSGWPGFALVTLERDGTVTSTLHPWSGTLRAP